MDSKKQNNTTGLKVYKNEDSLLELGNILSKDEAIQLVTKQMQP